jgi:hypothetical protein
MSKLEEQGKILSVQQTVKNRNTKDNEYNVGNPDAISDGDNFGKGLGNQGTVGSLDDIKSRNSQLVKNKYRDGNEYNLNNA